MYTMCINRGNESCTFPCAGRQTVLDAALSKGIRIEFACKGGGCGLCKIKVETGVFHLEKCSKAVLADEERKQMYALACKTYPQSDMTILIEDER